MNATEQHNAVLVYVAMKDRQLAVFADEGIYKKAGKSFWKDQVSICCSISIKQIMQTVSQQL